MMDCNWEHPGADPYWGKPIAAAVEQLTAMVRAPKLDDVLAYDD